MTDITAIGEILIDLTQFGKNEANVPLFAAFPGGAPANVAVSAARLGAKTAFIGKIGEDGFGAYLKSVLDENGVDSSRICTGGAPTTMAIVSVDGTGERSFQFVRGADCTLMPEEVDELLVTGSKILHFGSVSLTCGIARSATVHAARTAHKQGVLVSYDPNYRPALWNTEKDAVEWMTLPLPLVDVIKLSEEELPMLSGSGDLEEGSRRLTEKYGISLVLVTLGGKGAFCRWRDECFTVPGVSVKVADTNGAGDTFFGAVLSQLCRRGAKPLEGLERPELEKILRYANRAAAVTCSRSGAIPAMPTSSELEAENFL
ncbi:MAG: carbohydrate kinase [Oscillospiraceae bacterium]|nr:carbohydrate kinase [Oscillospiraceae bacterium]